MALKFPNEWRFNDALGQMPREAVNELVALICKVASHAESPQDVFEVFKSRFGVTGRSSNESWAQNDMVDAMNASNGELNIPEFIDSYWSAMSDIAASKPTPPPTPPPLKVNAILRKHGVGYAIEPPNLVREVTSNIIAAEATAGSERPVAYVIRERLGGGSYGEVFRASRSTPFGDFEFAMKLHHPSVFVDQARARKRFEREVQALCKLQHRAIVPYVDAGISGEGRPFLVMPVIEGANLRDATLGQAPAVGLRYMVEIAGAIAYAHENQVLHRDLKPSNILVRNSDSQPVIVDFGLAYILDDATQETLTVSAIGTAPYFPHDVIVDPKHRSPGHDVYSCGVVLYEILARRLPDPANYKNLANENPLLAPVDVVIRKALAGPDERFASARAFRDELVSAMESLGFP